MKSFQEFANKITVCNGEDTDPTNTHIPEEYIDPMNNIIENLKIHVGYFDKINIGYIEDVFNDINVPELLYNKTMDDTLPDGDIPDGLINKLSEELFGLDYCVISCDDQAIIKTLALYIIVQNLLNTQGGF